MKHKYAFLCMLLLALSACSLLRQAEVAWPVEPPAAQPGGAPTNTTPIQKTSPTQAPVAASSRLEATLGQQEISPLSPVSLHFNQPMDPTSAQPALLTYPWVEGNLSWEAGGITLTFTPKSGFRPRRQYQLLLSPNLKSASGEAFSQSQTWQIQVASGPQVLSHAPAGGQLEARQPEIRLTFDRPMDAESVRANLSVQPEIPFTVEMQAKTAILRLERPFEPGKRYNFTLAAAAHDLQGVPLEADYRWAYSLPDLVAGLSGAMMTASYQPVEAQPLRLAFNYAVERASFARTVRVRTSEQERVEGQWTWLQPLEATFEPAGGYQYNTTYTIEFEGLLEDPQGLPFPLPEPLVYRMPAILAYWPGGDFDQAPPETSILVQFALAVDQSSTQAAFQVEPRTPGKLQWEANRLEFIPDSLLQLGGAYTVTLGTQALDAQGRPLLEQPLVWRFQTQTYYSGPPAEASFGDYGPNAQVLDLNGRRAVQFVTNGRTSRVDFSLYRLSLAQFLERYSSGFKGVAGFGYIPISLKGAARLAAWPVDTGGKGAGYQGNIYETILPADAPAGLYVLNMQTDQSHAQLLVVLTRNTLVVKQAEGQLVAWVADINGGGIAGARVSVYARDGVLVAQGRSDADGVFRAQVERDPQPLIVVAEDSRELTGRDIEGTDISASGLSNEWQNSYNPWWGWWRTAPKSSHYAVYLQTDRPIYRPGQTVYFKAIARQDNDAQIISLPEGTAITLRVRDARDNVVQTFELATNDFGSVNGQFQLAEGAMLGDYNLEAVLNGESKRQVFKVQDYRKPDYQVAIRTDATHYVLGDSIQLDIDASYFFGQPVANAAITIQRYELQPYYSYVWDETGKDQPDYSWYRTGENPLLYHTDENGHFTLTGMGAQMGSTYNPQAYDYAGSLQEDTFGVEVTLDDGSHQTVSAFAVYNVSNSPEKLALEPGSWVQNSESPFSVRGKLTRLSGEALAGRPLRLELRQWGRQTYGYDTVLQAVDLVTDGEGQVSTQINVQQPGSYQLRLTGKDSRGEEIYANRWIYVISPNRDAWASQFIEAIKISADRESYAPGDIAQLAIESSFSGPALLTFERGTTRRVQPVELTSPLTMVEVQVQADDAPNIFVTVNAYQAQDTSLGPDKQEIYQSLPDSRLYSANVELKVPVQGKALKIDLEADQARYAPRQKATFHLRVTDEQGQPVVAEVSLALVDEAIYSLSGELSGPIAEAFYAAHPNLVRTYHSLALSRYLWQAGMGGGGGPEGAASPRSDFPDTAVWLPALVTDQNGKATLSVDLPDSLTSWRLSVRAVTREAQVGEAAINVTTQQEVVVRPILPRALTQGDQVLLSAMVHSYAAGPLDLIVSMTAEPADPSSSRLPLVVSDPITQQVRLQPGEVRMLGWKAQAASPGDATLTVQARPASGEPQPGDAVRLNLAVRPLAVADMTTQVGDFEGDFSTSLVVPDGILESSAVRVELSRSIAGSLLSGLEYLTGYPYGCVEQTMSRALPNAVIGRAFRQLGEGNLTLQADLPPMINAGLQRLYGFQHNDGGWGWWFDDPSNDYQTAWVVFGLSVTSQAGYEVDPLVIQRGANWLKSNMASMDLRTRAYALYSLAVAGYGDLEATRQLAGQASQMDTFSQAGLALALSELGAEVDANQMLDLLAESAVQREGYAYWPNPHEDGHYYEKTMASSVRSTALALEAFVRIYPDHPLVPGMVRWLMSQKRTEGWGSTNETSFTILALSDHLLTQEEATAETQYTVRLNGQVLETGSLGRGEPAVSLVIPASQLASGLNTLDVQQAGGGRLYYVISSRMLFPQARIEPAGGIRIERSYLDVQTGKPLESITAGQLVKVKLEVSFPQNGYFIIVEDQLPGGLEALNESLNTTSHEQAAYDYEQQEVYFWQELGYNNKEVHGERVSFFISEVSAGRHVYTYLARATRPGAFSALPAEVNAMYDLSLWGRSASGMMTVEAGE
jgi:uncharacterized protein YfaS (alpha-2-macroglobulin family)